MNRTDGLVRRAVRFRENGAEGGGSASGNANTPEDNPDMLDNRDHEDNIDDGDSKETRLTLMEEVLLLGLKDKEVSNLYFKMLLKFYSNFNTNISL